MKDLKIKIIVAAVFFGICFQTTINAQDRKAVAEQAVAEGKRLKALRTPDEMRAAIKKYEEALIIWRELGNKTEEASNIKTIGVIYQDLGDNERSLDYLNQAIKLAQTLGSKDIESESLLSAGQVYNVLGDLRRSFDTYKDALRLAREAKNQELEAIALVSLGYASDELGDKQNALDFYRQSAAILRSMNDKAGEASVNVNIGTVYLDLGETERAIDFYLQALPVIRESGNAYVEATILNNLGAGYQRLGDKPKALDFYMQGVNLHRKMEDRYGEAIALSNAAGVYDEMGDRVKALELFDEALKIQRETKARLSLAVTLGKIGTLYLSAGDYEKAFDYHSQSLALRREIGDIIGEAKTLYNLARTEQKRGNLPEANAMIQNAVEIIESVRASLVSADLRASYFAASQDYYKFQIDVLMSLHAKQPDRNFDALALQTSERARARRLLDNLSEAKLDVRQGIEKSLLERESVLQKQLNAKDDERRRAKVPAQAAALDKEIQTLTVAYQDLQAEIKKSNPRYAALTQPQPADLKAIQKMLDAETLLLEYSLGNESSYLWIVSNNSIKSFTLPKRADIEAKARAFYESVKKPQTEQAARNAAADLSKMLIEPAVSELGNKRLLIVADGVLGYIPFAALSVTETNPTNNGQRTTDNEQPLIVNHEIVYMPSASTLAVLREETKNRLPAPKTLSVLADPVFDANDTRVNRTAKIEPKNTDEILVSATREAGFQNNLPRLPFTRREATTILSLVPEAEKKRAVDFEASRATVVSPELAKYRIVHFATHGLLNSQHPELSGIVLSLVDEKGKPQNGFLRLNEIYNLKLPADLIVLSACQTALGKEIKGEGLIGLTRGFMYAGAKRVVASLWSVDDQATSELMKNFYQGMLGERKLPPAAALREAQITMWKTKRFNAPYFWSAFTLQGEWK